MRFVLALVLLATACAGPGVGPKVTDEVRSNDPATITTAPTAAGRPSLGGAPDDLHEVNWRQATVTAAFCGVEEPVRLAEGKVKATSTTWGKVEIWINTTKPVWYGDLDVDGRDEAVVNLGCDNGGGTASSELAFWFVVVTARAGKLEWVGEIGTTTMRDDAQHVPLLTEPRFEKEAITVTELWYRPSDANCCPTGASLTKWWLHDGVLRHDPAVQVS